MEVNDFVLLGLGFLTGYIFHRIYHDHGHGRTEDEQQGTIQVSETRETTGSASRATRLRKLRAQGQGVNHKMVFVVRTDLGMGKGKIVAQCSHAAVQCYQKAQVKDTENLDLWEANGVKKICLKLGPSGNEEDLEELREKAKAQGIVTALICDAGHTQVDPGTCTVLGIGPAHCEVIDKITGHLKLL